MTGGPSTGKSTLLTELAQRGYKTIPEAARTVIDEGILAGKTIEQVRANEHFFQEEVARRKVAIEAKLNPSTLTFFDRGMHDTLAYLWAHDYSIAPWLSPVFENARYGKVFLLDPVGSFAQDYARTEDVFTRERLQQLLEKAYTEYGMEPVRVPAMSPSERADFILKMIEEEMA